MPAKRGGAPRINGGHVFIIGRKSFFRWGMPPNDGGAPGNIGRYPRTEISSDIIAAGTPKISISINYQQLKNKSKLKLT